METTVGIILLCALYVRGSSDYYHDLFEEANDEYQGVLDLLTIRDCECTPNGTFLPDVYVANDRKLRPKKQPIVQIECSTINLNESEFWGAVEEYSYSSLSDSKFPVAYHLNCRRRLYIQFPCASLISLLNVQYLSLNGCSLMFPYFGLWINLNVLEVLNDVGSVVDFYPNSTYRAEYKLLSLFRWCPGNSNPLLTKEEIFPSMPVLRTFSAERCRLRRFPFGGGFLRTLNRSSHLELINLSQNDIQLLEVFNTSQLRSPHMTLDFSHNEIQNVTSVQLELLAERESIYVNLSHNSITDIDIPDSYAFTKPNVTIDLSYNKITTISQADFEHLVNATSTFVNLQNNQLDCDCRMSFLWEISLFGNYTYILSEKCASPKQFAGKYLKQLTVSDICQNHDGSNPKPIYLKLETTIILVASVVGTTVIMSVLMCKCRTEIRVVIYTKFGLVLPFGSRDFDENKRYDAFVAYSHEDLDWVIRVLFPMLTEDGNDFKICLNHKDFIPGKPIAENITDAVEWSRYTILVLSRHFLRSEWCKYEFRSAFDQSIRERKQQMIFILLEEIADDKMDSDLRKCLRFYTYIKADDVLLRERMTYALSDKRRRRRDGDRRGIRRRMLAMQPRRDEGPADAANIIQEAETVL